MLTNQMPDVKNDARYSVTATCQKLGIHRNTLLRWTIDGKIKCIFRKTDNRKLYTGFEILKCWGSIY